MSCHTDLTHRKLFEQHAFEHHICLSGESRVEATLVDGNDGPTIFKRALHGFVLLRGEEPDFVQPLAIKEHYWADFSLQGYAATLEGNEGLVVQTGHWFETVVKYQLVKIDRIQSLELRSDPAFRDGEPCMWLSADNYVYAMICPFSFCQDLWYLTLAGYLAPPCGLISLSAHPPSWWPKNGQPAWLRLQDARRSAALPSVPQKIAAHDTLRYPQLLMALSSRSGLAPLPTSSKAEDRSASGKRAVVGSQGLGAAADGAVVSEAERRGGPEPCCLKDPEILSSVLSIHEVPDDAMGLGERVSGLKFETGYGVANACILSWVMDKPMQSSAAMTEIPVDDSKTRSSNVSSRRRHAAGPAQQNRKASPTNDKSAHV